MEKNEAREHIATTLESLDLNPSSTQSSFSVRDQARKSGPYHCRDQGVRRTFQSPEKTTTPGLLREKAKPPSLVGLCLGVVGKHLEDIVADLGEIAANFPADIKIAIAAIARRRKLLSDDVVISLADTSWEILDLSGSDVSDSGLVKVTEICKSLRAVNISRCDNITASGVSELVQQCSSLETLRCGGSRRSDHAARRCLDILKPKLIVVEGDSWEELVTTEIGHGAQSLRWFVWPKIDKESLEMLSKECPRIIVNPPKPSPFGFRGFEVPREAFPDISLDDPFVKDIDPRTWAACGLAPRVVSPLLSPNELSMAEKFRLAFVERDTRLAPKRAKNARQHQRRAEREWMTSTNAKAIALASKFSKSLYSRK